MQLLKSNIFSCYHDNYALVLLAKRMGTQKKAKKEKVFFKKGLT